MNESENNGQELDFYLKHTKLTKHDKELLESVKPIVKAVANIFGKNCEVVLHSLEDPAHSVILIENPSITERKPGSPMTNIGIKALMKASETNMDVIGSYYTTTRGNKLLKSITALIKNSSGMPIGMFCININLSANFIDFVTDFVPGSVETGLNAKEQFITDIYEFIEAALKKTTSDISQKKNLSLRERNQLIIESLHEKNIFNIKGSVDFVADYLGMSKFTIYSYIRTIKDQDKSTKTDDE